MKKKSLVLAVTLALTLIMAFALTACGNSDSKGENGSSGSEAEQSSSVDFMWFKAGMSESLTAITGQSLNNPEFKGEVNGNEWEIKLDVSPIKEDTAENLQAFRAKSSDRTIGDDVTIGKYTWKTVNFTWGDDVPSTFLFLDLEDSSEVSMPARSLEITAFYLTPDSPELQTFLGNFELVSNIREMRDEAQEFPLEDFCKEHALPYE